ncbi:MAG: LegC family aminotransferase [Candidatus Omnitrophica bacterium]|nr:LegC family aminotransferase [Candidatus Omnitrophota bacterium]
MKKEIPISTPVIRGNEWKYIKECLDSGWVSSTGEYVRRFESCVAGYLGSRYAVATVNGTAALHVSLVACGVQAGEEVIVPAVTFVATANAVRYCNADPVFMDCDPRTFCIDIKKTARFLREKTRIGNDGFTYNIRSGKRIAAVIPVHVFGHPADMDELVRVCSDRKIDIIEDAKTGTFGRCGCLSFNGNKIITTGGGGMVVTDDEKIASRVRHLTTQARTDSFEYYHDEIGYNYRLTNIQAAMGVAQMEKLDEYIKIKRDNARLYRRLLSGLDKVELIWEDTPTVKSNFWFYTIRLPRGCKKPLMKYLTTMGIQVRSVWNPINTLPMYRRYMSYRVEHAVEVYETCINVPCSVDLKESDIHRVVSTIASFFAKERLSRRVSKEQICLGRKAVVNAGSIL